MPEWTARSRITVLVATLGAGLARGSVARAGAYEEFDASGQALARAETTADEPAPCAAPVDTRPPDPLCGERLDGRSEPRESGWWAVPRGALWIPRALSDVLLWPVVAVTDPIEHHHVFDHLEALLTSNDKTIGLRPELRYATGFLPVVGLRFFDHRLTPPVFAFDAHALTAGPAVVIGETELRGPAWSGLTLSALYHRRNDMLFAGIGPNSAADLRAQGVVVARYVSKVGRRRSTGCGRSGLGSSSTCTVTLRIEATTPTPCEAGRRSPTSSPPRPGNARPSARPRPA